jgi:hypothetical protein
MITRRKFLIGAGSALTLPTVNKFIWHIDSKGHPLIEKPSNPRKTLFVDQFDDFRIDLGREPEEYPTATWREFLVDKLGYKTPTTLSQFRDLYNEFGLKPRELDTDFDGYFEYWDQTEGPSALAYRLLEELNIGPKLAGPCNEVGGIKFVDGDSPGHDYIGVHAYDNLSISLLQNRLNELGTGIALELIS